MNIFGGQSTVYNIPGLAWISFLQTQLQGLKVLVIHQEMYAIHQKCCIWRKICKQGESRVEEEEAFELQTSYVIYDQYCCQKYDDQNRSDAERFPSSSLENIHVDGEGWRDERGVPSGRVHLPPLGSTSIFQISSSLSCSHMKYAPRQCWRAFSYKGKTSCFDI